MSYLYLYFATGMIWLLLTEIKFDRNWESDFFQACRNLTRPSNIVLKNRFTELFVQVIARIPILLFWAPISVVAFLYRMSPWADVNTMESQKERLLKRASVCGGGSGASYEDSVVIQTPVRLDGVLAERAFISLKHGKEDRDWRLVLQAFMPQEGISYDILLIETKNGDRIKYHFDISEFFGK